MDQDGDVEEFDEQQFELSTELANTFIESKILPLLEKFDFENEDEDYIPGVATFSLFTRLAIELLSEGYTVKEIADMIEDFSKNCTDATLH